MKLETFFAKFDQFADAPGAVAEMRGLVLKLSANGATHASLGQRPRKTTHPTIQALKGRDNPSVLAAMRMFNSGGSDALSGLRSIGHAIPKALPWAGMRRRVAAGGIGA